MKPFQSNHCFRAGTAVSALAPPRIALWKRSVATLLSAGTALSQHWRIHFWHYGNQILQRSFVTAGVARLAIRIDAKGEGLQV